MELARSFVSLSPFSTLTLVVAVLMVVLTLPDWHNAPGPFRPKFAHQSAFVDVVVTGLMSVVCAFGILASIFCMMATWAVQGGLLEVVWRFMQPFLLLSVLCGILWTSIPRFHSNYVLWRRSRRVFFARIGRAIQE